MKGTGEETDSAKIGDIDFSPDKETYERCLRFWDVIVEHKEQTLDEDFFSIYTDDYYRKYYKDRETYARQQSSFSTFAVVMPDGTWCEKGEMGWFGVSSASPDESMDWEDHYMERFIDNADPDMYITIVDCHI